MKQKLIIINALIVTTVIITLFFSACSSPESHAPVKADPVEANIKLYTQVWDDIMNKGKLDMFNEANFTKDVVIHADPTDVVGIDSVKAYYAHFITGFSNIQFSIKDVFGQGDKLVKYWNFKGTHTGDFFGIPATGNSVDLDGTTIVRMQDGKIAEERDFYDNLVFMTQLGLIPPAGE